MTAEVIVLADFRKKWAALAREREIAPIMVDEAVEICLKHLEILTDWEEGFLGSIRRLRRLSPRQLAVLQRIFDKVCRMVEGPLR
jgi:hypothetical protein